MAQNSGKMPNPAPLSNTQGYYPPNPLTAKERKAKAWQYYNDEMALRAKQDIPTLRAPVPCHKRLHQSLRHKIHRLKYKLGINTNPPRLEPDLGYWPIAQALWACNYDKNKLATFVNNTVRSSGVSVQEAMEMLVEEARLKVVNCV